MINAVAVFDINAVALFLGAEVDVAERARGLAGPVRACCTIFLGTLYRQSDNQYHQTTGVPRSQETAPPLGP